MILIADRIRKANLNLITAAITPCIIARGGLAVPLARFTRWILSAFFAKKHKKVRITENTSEWKGNLNIPLQNAVL